MAVAKSNGFIANWVQTVVHRCERQTYNRWRPMPSSIRHTTTQSRKSCSWHTGANIEPERSVIQCNSYASVTGRRDISASTGLAFPARVLASIPQGPSPVLSAIILAVASDDTSALPGDSCFPGTIHLATSMLDSKCCLWRTYQSGEAAMTADLRSSPAFAKRPVFVLHSLLNDGADVPDLLFGGAYERAVASWKIKWDDNGQLEPEAVKALPVDMGGHTGWVRAIAEIRSTEGTATLPHSVLMFSCACNFIKVWEVLGEEKIKHRGDLKIFRGDILALACSHGSLFAGVADGSIHCWQVDMISTSPPMKWKTQQLQGAHDGRVTSLETAGPWLFSAGQDGMVKVWRANDLMCWNTDNSHQSRGPGDGARNDATAAGEPASPVRTVQVCPKGSSPTLAAWCSSAAPGASTDEIFLFIGDCAGNIQAWPMVSDGGWT